MFESRLTDEEIFQVARQIASPPARTAYLQQVCAGDAALYKRVVALLEIAEQEASFLERPPVGLAQTAAPISEKPGDTIGPYKLMEQIGEGGFGLVFVAEQHTPVRRKAALKVIKPGMDTRDVVARFEAERQALAMMDHPHIAKVLDAGTTDSGRPYFVMELVRGVPITQYCDVHQLAPRERLALFVAVCHAVQHAHQKGVIHRDLKPSNILVAPHDGVPVVKVIDFGVAKALGQQLTEKTIYTQFAQLIGTPLYMSPEQAEINALDVDTRSDIYSLGVLLYELLTGTTPLDKQRLARAAFDEVRRLIREEEPPKPSTRVHTLGASASTVSAQRKTEPQKLRQLLRNELDWIVMKALEKDRTRRYETANGLARDIQRYLADEPVEACPPSTSYRLWKFARKYKGALVIASAFLALMLSGIAVSSWQAIRARNAEIAARSAEATARVQEQEATAARRDTAKERDTAVVARRQVEQANQQLLQAQGNLRNALYGARMNLIPGAWETGSLGRVQYLLAQTRPASGEEDLRGFEHGYWNRQLHGELRTVKLRRMQGRSAVLSASGTRVAGVVDLSGNGVRRIQVRDTTTGNELFSRSIPPGRAWMDTELSGDGSRVAWVECDSAPAGLPARGRLQVWDLNTGELLLSKEELYYIGRGNGQVYLNEDGTCVALIPHAEIPTPGKDPTTALTVWEVPSGRELLRQVIELPLRFVEGNLSPDGKKVAAVVTRNQVPEEPRLRIWDVADGHEQLDLLPDDFVPLGMAFIPRQNRVLLAGSTKGYQQQGTMQVRDAATGKLLVSWPEPELGTGKRYAVSPDGTRVAIVSLMSPLLHVRELETGRLLVAHKAHEGAIDDAAFSADGSRIVTVASQGELKEWAVPPAVADRDARQEFRGVSAFTISADGTRLAANKLATLGEVTILDADTLGVVARLQFDVRVMYRGAPTIALGPDGKALAVMQGYSQMPYVSVWDVASQSKRFELGPDDLGSRLQYNRDQQPFSPDGNSLALATVGENQSAGIGEFHVKVFDARTGELRHTLSPPEGGVINSCAFSPDGRRIAGVGVVFAGTDYAGQVTIWDLASGKVLHPFKHPNCAFFAVAFNPDGTKLAAGTGTGGSQVVDTRGRIVLWDLASGQQLHVLQGHSSQIYHLVFSPDGRRLASVGPLSSASTTNYSKGEVTLWDMASGQERLSLNVDDGRVFEVTFNHDGSKLLAPVENAPFSSLKIWSATPLPLSVEAHDVVVRTMVGNFPWQKGDIINRLKGDKTLQDELRQAALVAAQSWPEDSDSLNAASWNVVALQDQAAEAYRRALADVERAVKIGPDNGQILNTLGVAQYRVGKYAEAKETLTRALAMNTVPESGPRGGPAPSDLAFLAMACHQLGQKDEAASLLARLRERMKQRFAAIIPGNQGFLKEVETLLQSAP